MPPRKPSTRLTFAPTAGWTVGLAIATALEGLPGYDGATLADLTGQLTDPMPEGEVRVENTDDPLDGVRALMAEHAPGYALVRDAGGSLRLQSGAGYQAQPTVTILEDAPKPEA